LTGSSLIIHDLLIRRKIKKLSKYSRIWHRWKDNLMLMKIHIRNMGWKCFVRTRHGLKGCHVTKAVIAPMSGSQTPISKKVRQKRVYSCFFAFFDSFDPIEQRQKQWRSATGREIVL